MKRLMLTALAAAMLAAPVAAPAFAQGQPQQYQYNDYRDSDRNNGYYIGRAWHYGPPPASAYRARDYHPGYRAWKRGDRLGYYGNRYAEVDYRARHLKAPPRGYRYVKDDRGDILLAAVATGIIAAIIASAN